MLHVNEDNDEQSVLHIGVQLLVFRGVYLYTLGARPIFRAIAFSF